MADAETKKAGSSWLNVAVDYGPLLVFLAVYRLNAPDDPNPLAYQGIDRLFHYFSCSPRWPRC